MIVSHNHQNEQENISEGYIMNSSCGCGVNNQHKSKDQQEAMYQCPMNCEGNKTYNQPGECPVCNMQLVMVGQDEPRIRIDHYEGLTVDYCIKNRAGYLIRGLRTAADFEFERAIAQVNRVMAPDVESVFLLTVPEHSHINSSIVRDIIRSGGDASRFVPSSLNLRDYRGEQD